MEEMKTGNNYNCKLDNIKVKIKQNLIDYFNIIFSNGKNAFLLSDTHTHTLIHSLLNTVYPT